MRAALGSGIMLLAQQYFPVRGENWDAYDYRLYIQNWM
jgi:hypothetical protein